MTITNNAATRLQSKQFEVVELRDFLTKDECDRMISYALKSGMQPSLTRGGRTPARTSSQTWIDRYSQNCEVQDIVNKIHTQTTVVTGQQDLAFFEPLQLVRYREGQQFKAHKDGHDRHFTINIYLNEEFTGGETSFTVFGKSIKPETGKAVVWRNLTAEDTVVEESEHQGCVIESGTKFICTQWVKHASFFSKYKYRDLLDTI